MIDTWEIVGLLVTNHSFLKDFFATKVSAPDWSKLDTTMRWAIPLEDYEAMRQTVERYYDGPVSLMALGELIVARAYPKFEARLTALADAVPHVAGGAKLSKRDPYFYVGLGAMSLDGVLRNDLRGTDSAHPQFDTAGFSRVKVTDRALLVKIFDQGNTANPAADGVCDPDGSWNPDCYAKTLAWEDHMHPLSGVAPTA